MASFHRKIHDFSSKTHLKAPHFLVVIPKSICTQTKLRIPNNFFRKYGDDLSNPVFLKLPTGSEWKIELRIWEGEVWFGEGWPKFSKFYSLDCCHSLVFGYEGNSTFRVRVFDKDFTEINYPLTMPEMEETDEDDDSHNSSWDDDDDSDCVEVLDNIMSRSRKARDKSPLSCPRPHKKLRTSSTAEFAYKRHGEGTSSTPKRAQTVLGSMHASNARGKAAVALRRATAFKSDNPYFIVPMKRTYINGHSAWLPSKLCIHMRRLGKHSGAVTLRAFDGRTWYVEMKCEKATRPKLRLQYGWTEFVRGNNLEVGDVCVLVLIDDTKLVFEVVIFRTTETAHTFSPPDVDGEQTMSQMEETDEDDDSIEILDDFPTCSKTKTKSPIAPQPHKKNRTCSISTAENHRKKFGGSSLTKKIMNRRTLQVLRKMNPVTAHGTNRALQRARAFESEYPSCTVVMSPSYIHAHYVYLGAKFTKEHFLKRNYHQIILRVSDGRTWPVKLSKRQKNMVRLQNGWITFVQDNHLEIGDVCVFALINNIKGLMDVVIFRTIEAARCNLSQEVDGEKTMSQMEETDEDDDCVEILDDSPPCLKTKKKSPIATQPHKKNRAGSISTSENHMKKFGGSSWTKELVKRRPDQVPRMMNPLTVSGTNRALQRARAFKSEYPCCTVVMHPSYIQANTLNLEAKFAREHLLYRTHDNVILRVSGGRTWPVKLHQYSKNGLKFQSGWMKFVQDNGLEIGDVCVFMLINYTEHLIDVVIFRGRETADCTFSPGKARSISKDQFKSKNKKVAGWM
ncbi:B3 domain-containing protein Os03g0619600-like isoform X2 [Pyrus x bretschneideri]|uniref:B3 domain-containing protein Os03g0619600-like isoform X2 n=1 Tax=Pyrus x bretschneideri TaxID=225117 RepID=UPI00202E38DB|nr:B3 domain-containing protein Os03g0619600-like isoform X2 [Pyrus x bretschneideri]